MCVAAMRGVHAQLPVASAQIDVSCEGSDLDGNTVVDVSDLLMLLAAFGTSSDGDCNGNGVTDVADLLILLSNFGETGCAAGGGGSIVTITT